MPVDDIPVEELLDKVVSAVPTTTSAFCKTESKPRQQILLQAQQIIRPGNVQSMFVILFFIDSISISIFISHKNFMS